MKKLRVGIIGAGRIGRVHAENISRMRDVELVHVADRNISAAKSLASHYGNIRADESESDLIKNPNVEAVLICSSTDTHARLVEECSVAKKHIFCEKPVDLDLSKVRKAVAAVEKAGVVLQVGFNRRFDPNFRKAAEMVRAERLGVPHLVRITSRDPAPPPAEYVAVSGGIFLDMAIHDFDMARFLLNDEVTEVYATGSVLIDPAIGKAGDVDTAVTVLRFKSGALATIDNSRRACYGYDQRIEVFGSKGCTKVDNTEPHSAQVWDEQGQHSSVPHYFFLEKYKDAFFAEVQEFAQCVLEGKKPSVGSIDGLNSLLIALAAKKSLKEGRPVRISEVNG